MVFDIDYLKKGILRVVNVHIITLIISAFLTFLVPKILHVYDYGLWQLYIFYVSYLGFFHFGWIDGIYLRHVGKQYDELNKEELKAELIFFMIFQTIIAIMIGLFAITRMNFDKRLVFIYIALVFVFENVRNYFIVLLQSTGRVKEYSNVQLFERLFIVLCFGLLAIINKSFSIIIISDILARAFTLCYSAYCCKDIVTKKPKYYLATIEIPKNLSVGYKLMLGNVLSMLTTGVIRFVIERNYGVEKFGIVSFAMTISSLCIVTFNSMGIVFIPLIKNSTKSYNNDLYKILHTLIDFITFFAMIFYLPVYSIMVKFLPNYKDSFLYLAITFPIIYFGCIQSLLHMTYLKAFRKETSIFIANLIATFLAIILSIICTVYFENIIYMIITIIVVQIFKNLVFEYIINNTINCDLFLRFCLQTIIMTFGFGLCNYFIKGFKGFLLYFVLFIIWFLLNCNVLFKSLVMCKKIIISHKSKR